MLYKGELFLHRHREAHRVSCGGCYWRVERTYIEHGRYNKSIQVAAAPEDRHAKGSGEGTMNPYLDSAKIATRKVRIIVRNGLTKEREMARIDVERLHRVSRLQEENDLAGEADEDKVAH